MRSGASRPLAAAGAVAAAGYLAGLSLGVPWLRLAAKPLPALALAAWCRGAADDRYARVLAAGLLLSAMADALIEWRFIAGLAAFLAAHVCYTAAFWGDTPGLRPLRALPFAAYGAGACVFLRPGLRGLAVPVIVYMTAICAMMWRAAARLGASDRGAASERAALAGALLFAASDSLIALDRFHAEVPGVRYPIILLYWAGQLGIALSARRGDPVHPGGAQDTSETRR